MSAPSTEVGPGFLAFVAFFFLAAALWLLMRSMFTRMRRMNLAERAREQRQQEQQAGGEPAEGSSGSAGEDAEGAQDADSGLGDGPEEGQGRGDEV